MVSSKKVTGFFAIAVVAFMVATAFVPAVNAFATSDDDAAIATVKTDGDDQNQNIDITDKTDLMSILSSLFGGADVSKLAELFEGIDLKALMEEVSSLDSATIFDYVKGLLKQTGIFSGKDLSDAAAIISQLLEGDTDYNALLEMLMNLFGVEGSKSIYIPDLVIGDYELIGVTITVDFDEGEFSSASIDVSELIAEGDTGVEYAITGLYVLIATDVAEFYLKTIKFADAEFTIDTDAVLRLTDSGLELDVDVANDLSIFAELTITGMGVQEHISVTLAEVKVDTI